MVIAPRKLRVYPLFFISILFFIFFIIRFPVSPQEFDSVFYENKLPSPNKEKYEEQIKCSLDCKTVFFDREVNYMDEVWTDLGNNEGKLVIDFSEQMGFPLDSPELETPTEYLREIAKRNGHVSFEPLYIAQRGMGQVELPLLKDIYGIGFNIYKRLRSYFKFGRMENYNAKVLFHPTTGKIFYIYFFHRNYGHLCDTVYSTCDSLEYMDDELFDSQLSNRLNQGSYRNLEIKFSKQTAVLPSFHLDIQNLMETNKSARLYKWLIASKTTETKKVTRERFLTLGLAVQILDYSLTAYELVEAAQLYLPAREKSAEVIYDETPSGRVIRSVIFYPAK
ncbi:MAG: hypothetical protein O9301_17200 [Leptospira sp.]|nr:hypothetical protein [Leptospira sp.]